MKIFDYFKNRTSLINENKKYRKERNTLELKYNALNEEFVEFLKTELRFAKKYEEQLELNKQLKTELRNLKKELADVRNS